MTGKVIQGSFLTDQPRWSSSVQLKVAPSSFHAKTMAPPPTVFAPRPPQSPASPRAAQPTALQRHTAGGAFAVEAGALGIASGGGRPLPDVVRGKMEAALGADFSGVRVHVGPQAERIGAIAFTTGNDIYFAPGRYQPETIQGQQLLGHELAHVVQQRAGRVRNPLGSGLAVVQDRALEAEADRLGQHAATHRVAVQPKMPPGTAQPSAPVRISPPVSTGRGSYRLSAGAGGREIGSVMVHAGERGAVEVTDLGVDAAQRGNGVGQMLVAAAARTGLQSGRSKVTLAAQDRGSGHLTQWYKEMGFTQTGVNRRGYPQLEAPISRVLVAQPRATPQRGSSSAGSTPTHTRYGREPMEPRLANRSAVLMRARPRGMVLQRMDSGPPYPDFGANPDPISNVKTRMQWVSSNTSLPATYVGPEESIGGRWNEGHPELVNAHHKFPKRTLGWLWDHMTEQQQEQLRKTLFLPKHSGANALKRLRSNLIPPGPNNVRPDFRLDDPEHTKEFLDLVVIADTGRLTPRSSIYLQLAYLYETIFQSIGMSQNKLRDDQAAKVTQLLFQAEEWHFAIEGDTQKLAQYANDFWIEVEESKKEMIPTTAKFKENATLNEKKFVKGLSRQKLPSGVSTPDFMAYLKKQKEIFNKKTKEAIENQPMSFLKFFNMYYDILWEPKGYDEEDIHDEYNDYCKRWYLMHG